jgi:hypothetical protein
MCFEVGAYAVMTAVQAVLLGCEHLDELPPPAHQCGQSPLLGAGQGSHLRTDSFSKLRQHLSIDGQVNDMLGGVIAYSIRSDWASLPRALAKLRT